MIFTESFRAKIKLAKAYCLPLSIRFQTGVAYLAGTESSVRLEVESDLFGPVEIPGEMYFEGDSVGSIIDMIVKGANFEFAQGQAVATMESVRTVFRSVSGPEVRVPGLLVNPDYENSVFIADIKEVDSFSSGIDFAFSAIKGSKTSMFSNRIFVSTVKDKLLIFATDNTVANMSHFSAGMSFQSPKDMEFIFPAKSLQKLTKIMGRENTGIKLTCHRDCAIINLISENISVYIPLLMGSVPDYHEITAKVKGCDSSVEVKNVGKLLPPKEMLKVGSVAELSLSKTGGIQIVVLHTGASSLFDTGLSVSEDIQDIVFKVKKDEFFRSIAYLSGIGMSILLQWREHSPLFVAVKGKNYVSIHALELGER